MVNNNLNVISHYGIIDDSHINNFNNALVAGRYTVAINFQETINPPYVTTGVAYGLLEVKKAPTAEWIWQVYYPTNSSDTYSRAKANEGNWTVWVRK